MDAESLLVRKLHLPNFFAMRLQSDYERVASAVYFGDTPSNKLEELEARIAGCPDGGERDALCREVIIFHHPAEDVSIPVDVSENNPLLGACREIDEFRFG